MQPENPQEWTRQRLAALIDHSVLGPASTASDVERACGEARRERFAAVCVNSAFAGDAVRALAGSGIPVAVTIGFPLGACSMGTKRFEAREALEIGARELDVVQAVGALRAGRDDEVQAELAALVRDCAEHDATLKVILETCLLTRHEIERAIDSAVSAGAQFVKTSSGFGSAGAREEHVRLMRERAPAHVQVKAAGGIRSLADALGMLRAGASRLGCSSSLAILDELTGP